MIEFISKSGKALKNELSQHPTALALSTAGLGVSAGNFAVNTRRHQRDKDYQDQQLKEMRNLISAMKDTSENLKSVNGGLQKLPVYTTKETPKKKRRSLFNLLQKNNSHVVDYAIKGAAIGGGVGIPTAMAFLPKKLGEKTIEVEQKVPRFQKGAGKVLDSEGNPVYDYIRHTETLVDENSKFNNTKLGRTVRDAYNNSSTEGAVRKSLAGLGCIALGATLGAIIGGIRDLSDYANKKTTVNARLMKKVVEDLKKMGFQEGQHFVRDPKKANLMKTKVCILVSSTADTIKVVVNTVSDPKITRLSGQVSKNLPSMSTAMTKLADRFNELTITAVSGQNDSTFIASIAEKFIRGGYPVYLLEVG